MLVFLAVRLVGILCHAEDDDLEVEQEVREQEGAYAHAVEADHAAVDLVAHARRLQERADFDDPVDQ